MDTIPANTGIEMTDSTLVQKHNASGDKLYPRIVLQGKCLEMANIDVGDTIIFILEEGGFKVRKEQEMRPHEWHDLVDQDNTKVKEIAPYKGRGRVTLTGKYLRDNYKFEVQDDIKLKLRRNEIDGHNITFHTMQ